MAPLAWAQAWTQPEQQGYYRFGVQATQADHFYDPGGDRVRITTVGDYVASFYGEYGLTSRFTAVAYLPFFERITLNEVQGRPSGTVIVEGDAANGVADPIVGLRYGLKQAGPLVLSLGLHVGIPLGDDTQPNGLITGDGEFNQQVVLAAGYSFYPRPAYVQASGGFNNRTRGFSDELMYSLEAGYTFAGRWTLIGRGRGVETLENGGTGRRGGANGLYANNVRYLALGTELAYTMPSGWGVALGVEGAAFGQNVLSAPVFSLGVFLAR